jgi:hypothetical protein
MKTKLLLAAALVGAATLSTVSSAQAGVHFGFSFGLPLPPLPVVTFAAPAPVVVAPTYCAPAAVVAAPACPGPDYIWVPGYWNVVGHDRVWVGGSWSHRPGYVAYGRGYDYGRGHDYGRGYDNDHGYDRDHGWRR